MNQQQQHTNNIPISSLWVGNLSSDVTEADLTNLFGKYGAIVKITLYSPKYFAFVHFKLPEDAKTAKDSLQATILRGSPLKIDFAKPVCSVVPFSIVNMCILFFISSSLLFFQGKSSSYLISNLFDSILDPLKYLQCRCMYTNLLAYFKTTIYNGKTHIKNHRRNLL